jgi:hypothetical protein
MRHLDRKLLMCMARSSNPGEGALQHLREFQTRRQSRAILRSARPRAATDEPSNHSSELPRAYRGGPERI